MKINGRTIALIGASLHTSAFLLIFIGGFSAFSIGILLLPLLPLILPFIVNQGTDLPGLMMFAAFVIIMLLVATMFSWIGAGRSKPILVAVAATTGLLGGLTGFGFTQNMVAASSLFTTGGFDVWLNVCNGGFILAALVNMVAWFLLKNENQRPSDM